ncbi:alpha/beta fold hydrolase [Pseudonocardia kujensis]|uniref:alpha/beta fold hydrolase n=1 Tax=Pseudonocardia kujensis TaxID=1128675 RepID=UPI001E5ECE58|nr:alpha/beta hydrolase family protein [Pseudonocardia kujensis]MCE0768146.1 alpha/beta fold hydrolase [Pseudonocardia kujensis]
MGQPVVLVHGAYHGGWCWRRVAALLREVGHEVFTPTLTGLGERAHLLTPEVGLATMIHDVTAVLETEELTDVLLVGHSFGALPVLGAADRLRDRIARIVLLDGLVVEAGRRAFDGLPADVVVQRELDARRRGNNLAMPPPPAEAFGVTDPADAAWVERHLTPQPLRSYREPLAVEGPLGAGLPVAYVYCSEPDYPAIAAGHQVVKDHGWEWRDLPTGHDAMVTDPAGTVTALLA